MYLFKRHLDTVYQDCVAIYTGGSKDPRTGCTGSAFVVQGCGVEVRKRITDHLAVELMAILLAFQWLEEVKPDIVVICSDSCAVLMSLQSFSSCSRQYLLSKVLQTHGRNRQISIQIRLTWVPAHVGGEGNEAVDVLVKPALSSVDVVVSMSHAVSKSLMWTVKAQRWQEQWNRDTMGRHLFQVQRKVGEGARKEQKRGGYSYKIKSGTQPVEYVLKCDNKASNMKVWLLPGNRDCGACIATLWVVSEGKREAEI